MSAVPTFDYLIKRVKDWTKSKGIYIGAILALIVVLVIVV